VYFLKCQKNSLALHIVVTDKGPHGRTALSGRKGFPGLSDLVQSGLKLLLATFVVLTAALLRSSEI
jgi:hypothetical protein